MRLRVSETLKGGTFTYTHYQTVLVKATCDGVVGWGEAMTRFDPRATASLVRFFSGMLALREFQGPKEAHQTIWRELRVRGHTRGTDMEALSGIEIALNDCAGKIERRPLRKMLSRASRDVVPVFAGSLFESRGPLDEQVRVAADSGLNGAKVKVGFGPKEDLRVLKAVRKAWPEGMLVADANGAYDLKTAQEACQAFKGLGLAWFEEPVPSDDWESYRSLRSSPVPIGGGESWFDGELVSAVSERLVRVVEPSVSRCGGVSVEAETAKEADKHGVLFSPMCGMNSALSLAASLQVAAAFPTVGVEFNPFPNPLVSELAPGMAKPHGGTLKVPSGDGLGVEVDESFVKANMMD